MENVRKRMSKPESKLAKLRNLLSYIPAFAIPCYGGYSIVSVARSYYPSDFIRFFSSPVDGTKGLVLFSDIGKQARDLLFTDYQQGLKASLSLHRYRANVKFLGNDKQFGSFSLGLKYNILSAQLKYDVNNILRMRSSVDVFGLSGGLVASFPDQSSSKVSLGYTHPKAIANFNTSLGLFSNPLFTLSGVVGNHLWSLGFDASFDVISQNCRSMDFASSFTSAKFIASFCSCNRADLLKIYLHQSVLNSAYAVELSRQRSTNTSRIRIGYEHRFGSEVSVKARVDSNGTVAGLFQYRWNPGTFYRFSAQGGRNQDVSFGLACAFTA